jgi:hypothetical protein
MGYPNGSRVYFRVFVVLICAVIAHVRISASSPVQLPSKLPVDIILDCDPGEDIDDMGDLAILHTLANQGEINIVATMYSAATVYGAPLLEIVNRFYRRPELPIGVPKGTAYTSQNDNYGSFVTERFYHEVENGQQAPDARHVYRKLLANRAPASVTIVMTGQIRNIYDLYNSPPDEISPMSGAELLTNKVKRLIVVGGLFPSGLNFNFWTDPRAAGVFNQLTSNLPISFMGIEQGSDVRIGQSILTKQTNDPVRVAFDHYYTTFKTGSRPSWGGLGLLFAARGYTYNGTNLFAPTKGFIKVERDGSNSWTDNPVSNQEHLTKSQSNAYYTEILNELLMRTPLALSFLNNGNGGIDISWPTNGSPGYTLQYSEVLNPAANWKNYEGVQSIKGDNFTVPFKPEAQTRYYRLKRD